MELGGRVLESRSVDAIACGWNRSVVVTGCGRLKDLQELWALEVESWKPFRSRPVRSSRSLNEFS